MKAALILGVLLVLNVVNSAELGRDVDDGASSDREYFYDGNTQLKLAYDAAFLEGLQDGTFSAIWARYGLSPISMNDCILSNHLYAHPVWPKVEEISGTFRKVLETGVWKVVTVKNFKNLPWQDATTWPSTGAYPEFIRAIANIIGDHYNRVIAIHEVQAEWVRQNNDAFRLLWNNTVDSTYPNFHKGGFALGSRRNTRFQASTCYNFQQRLPVYTRTGEGNPSSWGSLNNAFNSGATGAASTTLGVVGDGVSSIVSYFFPRATIRQYTDASAGFTALGSGSIIALFGGQTPNTGLTLNLISDAPLWLGTSTLFRRDEGSSASEGEWDEKVPSSWIKKGANTHKLKYLKISNPELYEKVRLFRDSKEESHRLNRNHQLSYIDPSSSDSD